MSKTRQQKAGEQSNMETYLTKKDSQGSEFSNSDIKKMFEKLEQMEKNQASIQNSINDKNKEDDKRMDKNDEMVESMSSNVNRITDNLDKIIPRMGEIENRLSSIEDRLDSVSDLERNLESLEEVEQALPRLGNIEDRLTEIEQKLESNDRMNKEIKDLQEKALWEEYERKKNILIVYGLEGSESPDKTTEVAKQFMKDSLKIDAEWVDNLHIKSCIRLQGNGKSPLPLRMTFFWPEDKDKCLRAGYNLKNTKLSIRTDLPKSMRVERAKLASKAYNLKKNGEAKHTKIKEKGISLWLVIKKNDGDNWAPVG